MSRFFEEALIPHAKAEDGVLWPLARSLKEEKAGRVATALEEEHRKIDSRIAAYQQALKAAERGQRDAASLFPLADSVGRLAELHFAKEKQSLIKPLQETITPQQFAPVVLEVDRGSDPGCASTAGKEPRRPDEAS